MSSGGARARSGPAPDRNALRRNRTSDRGGWIHLPATGREGDTPAWPLPRATKFELERWEAEWLRPQAIMWERRGWEIQVALYVRTLRIATGPKATATATSSLLRQMVNLGLTEDGLARNRWILDEAPAAPQAPRRAASSSAKDRLSVITGGGDARAS